MSATLREVTPTPLCGNTITKLRENLTAGIAPNKLLKIGGEKGTSQ